MKRVNCRARYLACVLLGVVMAVGAFGVRYAIDEFLMLQLRVAHIEGYLGALDQMLRSAR